ncbi:Clf1 protein [Martiniozyma asiatica (nom. inval.)]|nr:Clf1 protein [Martiniozyma asiatica]
MESAAVVNGNGKRPHGGGTDVSVDKMVMKAYKRNTVENETPDFRLQNKEELRIFQGHKRSEYENALRRNRFDTGQWMRYARFEVDQRDFPRARSIFERAIEIDYKNVTLWVRYIQTEIKFKNINHARNLLDRATALLPKVDKLWYMYLGLEESVGSLLAVRDIYQSWLQWVPPKAVWLNFLEFESRYGEYDNERLIFEKFVVAYPDSDTWSKWAEFEKHHGDLVNVRNVYKLAVNTLFELKSIDATILINWINWELSRNEMSNVERLIKFGKQALANEDLAKFEELSTDLWKIHGNSEMITSSVILKRKNKYRSSLKDDPTNYLTWWAYLTLLLNSELETPDDEAQSEFERAVANKPTSSAKWDWTSYLYIWYLYLTWKESKDIEATKLLFQRLASIIPHKEFTFVNFWIRYAEFELRNFDLQAARKILGQSIGMAPNAEIIDYYIELEMKLKYFDRVRVLYGKHIECFPSNVSGWLNYANFEQNLGDDNRSFAIVTSAVYGEYLSTDGKIELIGDVVDSLIERYNFKLARNLLETKVEISNYNVKHVIQRCLFELKVPTAKQIEAFNAADDDGDDDDDATQFHFEIEDETIDNVRVEFERFISRFRNENLPDKRILLLEALKNFELQYGTSESVGRVEARLPKISKGVKDDGAGNKEEFVIYSFPEDKDEVEAEIDEFAREVFAEFEASNKEGELDIFTADESGDEDNGLSSRFAADESGDEDNGLSSRFAADESGDEENGLSSRFAADESESENEPNFKSRFEE